MKTSRLVPLLPEGVKSPVAVSTTENIDLNGLQNINGYQLQDNDRVLVKNQDLPFNNGIYTAHTTGWVRARDWKVGSQVASGVIVMDNFTGKLWRGQFTEDVFNVGLTAIEFDEVFIDAQSYEQLINTIAELTNQLNDTVQSYTLAELQEMSPTLTGRRVICSERADAPLQLAADGYTAQPGDITAANGRVWELQLTGGSGALVEWFDSPQEGVDRLKSNGGGTLYAVGRYTLTETLVLDGGNVKILGIFVENVFSTVVANSDNSVFYADFTDGPAILISDGGVEVEGVTVKGSPTRRSAAISGGPQEVNAGILIEGPDVENDILQGVTLRNVKCVSHPADGILCEGDNTNIEIDNCYQMDCGRHGIAITDGELSGRINKSIPGIFKITRGKSFDLGGHGLAIGHPSSAQFPYRVQVSNVEGYRQATDPSVRYSTASNWAVCQDSTFDNCAFGGTTTGNTADHEGIEVGGRDIRLVGCRYISCQNNYVIVRQQAGFSTENIEFDGGIANTANTTPPDDFALLSSGVDGVHIKRVDHDGANPITDISYDSTNSDILLHDITENKTIHANHTEDFTDSTVLLNNNGGALSISSANVTIPHEGFYTVDTEGDAASDALSSILGGRTGDKITLRQENSGRVVTINDATGNIRLSGSANYTFPNTRSYITLMLDGSTWQEVGRSEN